MRWVVSSNLGNAAELERVRKACVRAGVELCPVKHIPFSAELPDVPTDEPTVFYGATGFVTKAWESKLWQPGVWYCRDAFDYMAYYHHYREQLLNCECDWTDLAELATRDYDDDKPLFIRPISDLKPFPGDVICFGDIKDWTDSLSGRGWQVTETTPIVVATPVDIEREWRLFMVAGVPVAGSLYREGGRLRKDPTVPADIKAFATGMAQKWSPAGVFVMDVCSVVGPYLDLRVVELNCFNSCGFYAANVDDIVSAVSRYAQHEYIAMGRRKPARPSSTG